MKRIVSLGFQEAVEKIKDTKFVMYRSGVWNGYAQIPTENAIKGIMSSGYGADIYVGDDNTFFVSIPCTSDMW